MSEQKSTILQVFIEGKSEPIRVKCDWTLTKIKELITNGELEKDWFISEDEKILIKSNQIYCFQEVDE